MSCGLTCVDDFLNRAFYRVGLVVGRHPGYFVIIPVLLAGICITGYQQIRYEIDPEYLFSPINGPGKSERVIVESFFKVNYTSRFSVGRITRPGRFGHVIVVPKDGDDNMLRAVIWKELLLLDGIIRNATLEYEGETYSYENICARWLDQCFMNDILNLHHVIDDVESRELNLTFPVMFNPVTWDAHAFPVYFGGSIINDDSTIETVPSIQLAYFVTADTKRQDAIGALWEEAFLNIIGKAEDDGIFKHISTARFASRTLELELEANTRTVVPYFSSTFAIMAIFSVVTCMMADWVRSKPWLGLLGNVSAAMATVSAFGLCMYLGIEFIGINLAAPFLMIGIGIDDTFVVLAAWRRSNILAPVPERMAVTLSEAAVSITITSLTDMISFFIGIMSPFPSVQIFCIYSGFAVIFTFFFHLTFFSGCVAISGYCEQKNLHSVVCCKVQPVSKSTHRSWLYRILCTGGVDPADPDNPLDNPEHGCMVWFRDYLAVVLNNRFVKALVIVIFTLYLCGALYGLTTLEEGLDRRKLSKEDSYSVAFYDKEDFYFREFPYRIQVIVSGQENYSDPVVQQQFENLTRALEASSYISSPIYTESWIRSFLSYVTRNQDYLNVTIDTEASFIKALKDIWLFPANPFSLDVKFDETGQKILASRFLIQAVNISGTNEEKAMVKELRRICNESPLNASVFHPYFVFFDQFELVRPTSIQCMVYGALIMMLISFIFIPNALCCLWVAFCIVSIELGVGGYMALWGVNLDSISMINLIMCIGFSVDFTAHICYAYMSSKKKHPDDRVKECLYSLGLPIVQGAASTILGLGALLLANTYIFLVFFKMVFLVIFIGAMHGLFLLPVLLSIFGPGSCSSHEPESKEAALDPEGKPHRVFVIPHPSLLYPPGPKKPGQGGSPVTSLTALEDRDPGLGTSEDSNSTESGSSQSRRRQQQQQQTEAPDADVQRRYLGWRRSVGVPNGLTNLQPAPATPAPPPDYPGATLDRPLRVSLGENLYFGRSNPGPDFPSRREYRRSRSHSHHNLQYPPTRYQPDPRYP
ncbi:patched domain-containing protein 3 [Neodiprion virginianus]|uniref:patched domain-containing protein 3 n=1 Tax=Neodiprion fabricii TaxID=2872261 RepID=UPI001ED94001|nr:patched domain-containing protein 3 [Neodiprion fabricii]XP_046619737.1 patched domain-containing protein 3 [Neodiprion virginianus]